MELLGMGSDFYPDVVVENYNSLIWTERYREPGDFELQTYDIDRTMDLLPIGSMVTLRNSPECMFVESHAIERKAGGEKTLTITGRSFESFFENRVAHELSVRMFTYDGDPEGGIPPYAWQLSQSGEAASKYAYEMITYLCQKITTNGEVIPNLSVVVDSKTTLAAGKTKRFMTIALGTLHERLMEVLSLDDLGLRAELPTGTGTKMTIRIYEGVDRSADVIFSTSQGHFTKESYLFSNRDYKNGVHLFSQWDWTVATNTSDTGLNRRFGIVEATDITHDPAPAVGSNPDEALLQARGATYLSQNKKTATFSGELASELPYKYERDYKLGDIIRIQGEYGLNQKMRISEYIRIEDVNGEREYPTLVLY